MLPSLWKQTSNASLVGLTMAYPLWLLARQIGNPTAVVQGWMHTNFRDAESPPPVGSQLLAYVLVGTAGFVMTDRLIPNIKVRISLFVSLFI